MAKLKIYQVINAYTWVTENADSEIGYEGAFRIAYNHSRLEEFINTFNKQRESIVDKYALTNEAGEKIEDDGNYQLTDADAFQKEMEELLQTEVEVDIQEIPINLVSGLSITTRNMASISFLFKI